MTPTPVQEVHFDGWHARLDAAARATIARIAADPPNGRWYVAAGYTDASHSVAEGRDLAQSRARAVAAELVRLGVAPALMHVRGDDGAPVSDPPGAVGDRRSNRVAIWICYADAPVCADVWRRAR
ncbi:MAG: OmpA family protein [Pseudomonadota bacterium]